MAVDKSGAAVGNFNVKGGNLAPEPRRKQISKSSDWLPASRESQLFMAKDWLSVMTANAEAWNERINEE
jgi:hypothetical protein